MKLKKWSDIFTVGKHKGKTVEDVFEVDPAYLHWATFSSDMTEFDPCMKDLIMRKNPDSEISYEDMDDSWGDRD